MFQNCDYQIDSKNGWLFLSASFTAKAELVFVLTLKNAFPQRFYFEANIKTIGSSKTPTRDFQNRPLFQRQACFYVTVSGDFGRFLYFNFETNFQKTKTFDEKLEKCFLVESTNTEGTSLPYKTAVAEANVKKNRMVSTTLTYHKERSFASNYFIFLEILFQFKNLL